MEKARFVTTAEVLSTISIATTFLLGLGIFINSRRTNSTNEKKVSLEEQIALDESEDRIASRRLTELNRLDAQVKELLARVKTLEDARVTDHERMTAMEDHLDVVEAMIPNPPGPPPRPWLAS